MTNCPNCKQRVVATAWGGGSVFVKTVQTHYFCEYCGRRYIEVATWDETGKIKVRVEEQQ